MATYTSNYAWTKPEGSDPVDIGVLNNNLDSQDSIVHNAYMQFAPVFSTASTYAVDDVVLYANNLYKCITAVTVAGDWDATKWTQVKVSDICGGGGGGGTSDYSQLTNKPSINSVTLSGNKTTADLGLQDAIQLDTMPTASATYAGKIVQFVGTTTASYTHGYYYECINNGGTYSWSQINVQPSSGGGSSDYTDLTNKPQINGVTLTGNKSTSDLGIPTKTVIDWADWILLTPQEQETGSYDVINCPWADNDVSVELMTKLWENPSPTSAFAAGSIQLSSSDYDLLLILASNSSTNDRKVPATIGNSGYLNFAENSGQSAMNEYRGYVASGTTVTFDDATKNGTTDNTKLIPLAIYGIKTTAKVKINAIASDVNTSADHCMLSDGVTSVEDVLTANTFGTAVDITSYTSSSKYTCPSDGYIFLNATAISVTNGSISVAIDAGSNPILWAAARKSFIESNVIYAKKGMQIYASHVDTGGKAYFYPLQ